MEVPTHTVEQNKLHNVLKEKLTHLFNVKGWSHRRIRRKTGLSLEHYRSIMQE